MVPSIRRFVLAVLWLPAVSVGQSSQWQYPSPTGAPLADVAVAARGGGAWAVGAAGTILASADSGRTWRVVPTGVSADLCGVASVGPSRVWAAGAGGTVLVSTDGGGRWERQGTGVRVALRGIAMLDARQGWASGDGVILATSDGGRMWRPVYQQAGSSLARIAAFDRDRVLAIGWREATPHATAVVLRTEDGGRTWHEDRLGPRYRPLGLWVEPGGNRAWIVGAAEGIANAPPLAMHSSDGGRTWTPHVIRASGALSDVIVDGDVITAVGVSETKHAWVVQSTDSGGTWRPYQLPLYAPLRAVAGARATRLVAVGDGGTTVGPSDLRERAVRSASRATLRAARFVNPQRGCAVGDDGLILCTSDGGQHWASPSRMPAAAYSDVAWTSRDVAYVVGEAGTIMRTLDGGRSWEMRPAMSDADFVAVAARAEAVWVVGAEGFAMRSGDRGNTWTQVDAPARERLIAVDIAPDGTVATLTASGRYWRMGAGRDRWSAGRLPVQGRAVAIASPAAETIIAVVERDTTESVLVRSRNGGRQWEELPLPARVEGMAFRSPDEGAVVAGNAILATRDGGHTWRTVAVPGEVRFRGVEAIGEQVWAVGDHSTIVHATP